MRTRLTIVWPITALALVVTACGSDDQQAREETSTTAQQTTDQQTQDGSSGPPAEGAPAEAAEPAQEGAEVEQQSTVQRGQPLDDCGGPDELPAENNVEVSWHNCTNETIFAAPYFTDGESYWVTQCQTIGAQLTGRWLLERPLPPSFTLSRRVTLCQEFTDLGDQFDVVTGSEADCWTRFDPPSPGTNTAFTHRYGNCGDEPEWVAQAVANGDGELVLAMDHSALQLDSPATSEPPDVYVVEWQAQTVEFEGGQYKTVFWIPPYRVSVA